MSRTQAICDRVKAIVNSGDLVLDEDLRAVAQEFSELNRTIDQRLRHCSDFLARGRRVEALHQADLQPRLLDEIAAVSFPERRVWDDLTSQYGIGTAPRPDPDRAAELNRSYSSQVPVEALTRKLRALSRTRATVAERLTVLNELARLDPDNPNWTESLQLFEVDAFKQLATEGAQALAKNDLYYAEIVLEKLTAPHWKSPAPADIVVRLARITLPMLYNRLEKALNQNQRADYLDLKDRVSARLRLANLKPGESLEARTQSLIARAEAADLEAYEDEQYQVHLEEVARLLQDRTVKPEFVQRAYARLLNYDTPIPRSIEKLHDEWESRNAEKKSIAMNYLAIGLIAFGLLFLIILVLFMKR